MIFWALLTGLAAAQTPSLQLQTVAEVRHDLFGERMVPFAQYVRIDRQAGEVGVHADAALEWLSGLDQAGGVDIYTLHVERPTAWGDWTIGRQQAPAAKRVQTFDGARFRWEPGRTVLLGAWGGIARHQDLDDLRDGVGMGRLEAFWHPGALRGRVGVQIEGAPDSAVVVRQDAEFRYAPPHTEGHPHVGGRLLLAQPEGPVEWARIEAGLRPHWSVDLTAHAQHREVVDLDALFGERLLQSLVGGRIDEIGLDTRWYGTSWPMLSVGYALAAYGWGDEPQYGHRIDASWVRRRSDGPVRFTPAYTFRSGPGGVYHAAYATTRYAVDDLTSLLLRVAVVPFRKAHFPWDVAANVRIDGERTVFDGVAVGGHVDVASDRLYDLDLRIGATVRVWAR